MKTLFNPLHLLVVVVLCCLGLMPAAAQNFTAVDANGNTLKYYASGGTASVRGLEAVSSDAAKAGRIVIPAEVYYEAGDATFPVTYVSNSTFDGNKDVVSVKFGANVQTINSYAFYNCSNLVELDFTEATSLTEIQYRAFEYCTSLTSVTLPASVATLGIDCFYGCEALRQAVLPDALTAIPSSCFGYCTALESVTLGANVESIGSSAFNRCYALRTLTLPASLTSLGSSCFSECSALTQLVLPGATMAFTNNTYLPTTCVVYVPADLVDTYKASSNASNYRIIAIGTQTDFAVTTTDGGELQAKVEAIGAAANVVSLKVTGPINGTDINYLHQRLTALQELDLGAAQIVSGGDSYNTFEVANNGTATANSESYNTEDNKVTRAMFWNMPLLRRIVLPTGVTYLGRSAFGKCLALEECVIPDGVTEIAEYCFANSTSIYSNANQIVSLTLPANLQTIGHHAFTNMDKLATISIPVGVTDIPEYAFYDCDALRSISLPAGLLSVGNYAFNGCAALESLTLPASLTTLGNSCFTNCSKIAGTVTIPGTVKTVGGSAFYGCSSVEAIVLEEGVETVESYAFYNNNHSRSVSFPSTLTSIKDNAFGSNKCLESVTLPAGLTTLGSGAFSECDSLRVFTFPDAITSVPSSVLSYCDNLERVTLAPQTTTIGESAFRDCPKLTDVNFNLATLTKIQNTAFYNTGFTSVTLPEQVVVNNSCFNNCKKLQSVNLPSANTSVPNSYVKNCTALTSVTLPAGVTEIKPEAFSGCTALPTIDLPAGMTTIGSYAFQNCTALELSALPTSLTTIGTSAFNSCKTITALTIPETVTKVESNAFWGSGLRSVTFACSNPTMGTYVFRECDSLTNVVLPSAMTELPYGTFQYCKALASIDLPATLKTIGGWTFYHCEKLTGVVFPEGLTTINDGDFQYTALTEVTIPDNVTKVGDGAFSYCQSLRYASLGRNQDYTSNSAFNYFSFCQNLDTLRLYAGMPPAINAYYAPANRPNIVLVVPAGTDSLYANADVWKEFGTLITFLTGDKLDAVDYAIMKKFYAQMNGDGWLVPWDLETDDRYIGKWKGVTTEGDHIVSIDLTAQGLAGELKADIFTLPELQTLNLTNNAITGRLENVIGNTAVNDSTLTEVNLSGNQLEGDVSPFAASLPQLTKLNVSYNRLTAVSTLIDHTNLPSAPSNFDYSYQFVDYYTKQPVVTDDYPAVQVRLGEPFEWQHNTLQTYNHSASNWSYNGDNLYNYKPVKSYWYDEYYLEYAGRWLKKNSEGLYTATSDCDVFKGTRDLCIMDFGSGGWATQPFRFDWVDGDVNIDLTVDVTDLQGLIYYALNDSRPSSTPFNYTTADGNGDNSLNVLDCIINVNRILDFTEPGTNATRALYNIMYDARNLVAMERRQLRIGNSDAVAALQLTLYGCRADDITLSPALSAFRLAAKEMEDGGVRVIVYSIDGNVIPAGETTLFDELPAGTTISDVRLSDAEGARLGAAISESVTGISGVTGGNLGDAEGEIYDISGRRLATGSVADELKRLPSGVYIVKTKDGQFKIRK